jgi:hypothetical protein
MDLAYYDWFLERIGNLRTGHISIDINILRERLDYNKPPEFVKMLKEIREGYNTQRPKDFSTALEDFIEMINTKYNMNHYIDQTVNAVIFEKKMIKIGLIDKNKNLYGPIDAYFGNETDDK